MQSANTHYLAPSAKYSLIVFAVFSLSSSTAHGDLFLLNMMQGNKKEEHALLLRKLRKGDKNCK